MCPDSQPKIEFCCPVCHDWANVEEHVFTCGLGGNVLQWNELVKYWRQRGWIKTRRTIRPGTEK